MKPKQREFPAKVLSLLSRVTQKASVSLLVRDSVRHLPWSFVHKPVQRVGGIANIDGKKFVVRFHISLQSVLERLFRGVEHCHRRHFTRTSRKIVLPASPCTRLKCKPSSPAFFHNRPIDEFLNQFASYVIFPQVSLKVTRNEFLLK